MTSNEAAAIAIRPTTRADLPAVEMLIRPFVEQRLLLPRRQEEIITLLQHGFAADCAGDVVGFAAVEVYSRKMAEIQCLAVSAEHQGKGIGRDLVVACVQRAKELDVVELMAITASEKLFQDCGFDFSLPGQKKALFVRTNDPHGEDGPDSTGAR